MTKQNDYAKHSIITLSDMLAARLVRFLVLNGVELGEARDMIDALRYAGTVINWGAPAPSPLNMQAELEATTGNLGAALAAINRAIDGQGIFLPVGIQPGISLN